MSKGWGSVRFPGRKFRLPVLTGEGVRPGPQWMATDWRLGCQLHPKLRLKWPCDMTNCLLNAAVEDFRPQVICLVSNEIDEFTWSTSPFNNGVYWPTFDNNGQHQRVKRWLRFLWSSSTIETWDWWWNIFWLSCDFCTLQIGEISSIKTHQKKGQMVFGLTPEE